MSVDEIVDSYQKHNFQEKKSVLKKILREIFEKDWFQSYNSLEDILESDFQGDFEDHFRDPLSSSILELVRTRPKHREKRQKLVWFGFYSAFKNCGSVPKYDLLWRVFKIHR